MKTICVIATASAFRGALMIYNQFLSALELNRGDDKWCVFVDKGMPMPDIPNVTYHVFHTKGIGRIWFDCFGFKKYIYKNGIEPDVIFSLQNSSVRYKCLRHVIYYHQPLPLYKYDYRLSDDYFLSYYLYSNLYPVYVKFYLLNHTYVAVQTKIIRNRFADRYNFPVDRIGVYFPTIGKVDAAKIQSYDFDSLFSHFFYPANSSAYKEQITLAHTLCSIRKLDADLANQIRIHLTVSEYQMKDLVMYIKKEGLESNFIFHGNVPHKQVLSMLKSSHGLLFPSVIETLGLPLLEAACMGVPIIANDMEYVHEVLGNYKGVAYASVHDYDDWGQKIIECCHIKRKYESYSIPDTHSWDRLFKLIREGVIE